MFLVLFNESLNQIFEDISLYSKTTETHSSTNKNVNTVFTKNK